MSKQKPKPELAHLRPETAAWVAAIEADYVLESHHRRLLQLAAEAWDESRTALESLQRADDLVFMDRYSQPRERPELGIVRQARTQFARLVRELGLDIEPPAEKRPPRIGGQRS